MRLRHIEIFHAIYTTGSVTNAAKLLHVSQPSVSKVLSHAEQQLGFKLFDRVKGRLEPTNEAVLLFAEADRVYQQLNTINLAAENIKNKDVGRIAIAMTPALGFDLLTKEIALFRTRHPGITFDIQTLHNDQVQKHLMRRKSEIAIMFAPEKLSGIKEILFGYGKTVVVYPKSLLPHLPTKLSLSEVTRLPFISIWDSGPLANQIWQKMVEQNITPPSSLKVQTYFIAVNLVKHGTGVCIVDEFTARGQLSPEIAIAELEESIGFPIKGLYLETAPFSHVLGDFIESLKARMNSENSKNK